MIYHVTYLSGGLRVKGYLSLPHGYELPISTLQILLNSIYNTTELPITEITTNISRNNVNILSHRFPALLYCRGGIGKVGRVQTHWIELFANSGYVVFAPSYRGNEGGEGRDEFGGADQEDVHAAFRLIQSLPFVDTSNISLLGFSRGAINATHTSIKWQGINRLVLWGGVTNLTQTYEERVDLRRMLKRVIGGSPAKVAYDYQTRSPICLAKDINCPVLIIHGCQDIQVNISHGRNMYSRLMELGKDVTMHTYEEYGHHFPPLIHQLATKRMFSWIQGDSTE
jgi:dipeptidyl aminopeptidase/acylaminoacyl peptidase